MAGIENTIQEKSIPVGVRFPLPGENKNNEIVIPTQVVPSQVLPSKVSPVQGDIVKPGEYNPAYCEAMVDFFLATPITRTIVETMTWKNGEVREIEKEVANPPPMISEFARSIGVRVSKLKAWRKKHIEFAEAVDECQEIVKEFIIKNGLAGKYPTQFAIFAGKNLTDMKDKQIRENRNLDINKVLDQLEKGTAEDVHDGFN